MHLLKKSARIIFGIPFIIFGINHLLFAEKLVFIVPSFIPGGVFWVYLTGVGLIAAGISYITEVLVKWASIGLSVFLCFTIFTVHLPGMFDTSQLMTAVPGFLKDTAILGEVLYFIAYYSGEK